MNEELFRTYVTDELGSMQDCYIGYVLDDGYVSVLGLATELYGEDEDWKKQIGNWT